MKSGWLILVLFALVGCGGTFVAPISQDQIEPLLVLDLRQNIIARSPEGVAPTNTRLIFRRIPAGTRTLSDGDILNEEGPVATTSTTNSQTGRIWLCTHELSQGQWNQLAGSLANAWNNVVPSSAGGGSAAIGDDMPAWGLSASDCVSVCTAWSNTIPGYELRLPTSLEWESAARSPDGSGLYGWGNDAGSASTFARVRLPGQTGAGPRPITGHAALGGFLDIHGNVWEWVSDGSDFNLRGGSWNDDLPSARSGNRRACPIDLGYALAGVRLILVTP